MLHTDTYLADLKTRKQTLQLQLNEINTQMATIRAHYSERRSNLILKPSAHSKDHELRKLQPAKEQLQANIQALREEIAHIQAAKQSEKQIQAQSYHQEPVDQAEIELIRARCKQGKLIVTNKKIVIELSGFGQVLKSQMLLRSALTGIDSKLAVPSVFGMGGGVNLTFHGKGGELLNADLVPLKKAKEIMVLLN